MNINSFQRMVWNEFFSHSLQTLLDSKSFTHKGVSISYEASNASAFLRTPLQMDGTQTHTLKIKVNIEHKTSMASIPRDLIVLPLLGSNGFVLDGVRYSLISKFRLASGWYIKQDKKGEIYLALQRESVELLTIQNPTKGLAVCVNGKYKLPLFDFLRAISGTVEITEKDILDEFSDCSNILYGYYTWRESNDYVARETREIAADVYKAFRMGYGNSRTDPVADLKEYLSSNRIRMHSEKIPRFKKFTSFKRAIGTTLAEDVETANEHFYAGEVLTSNVLTKIDSDPAIKTLCVTKDDILYTLKKADIDINLTYDEVCCALRVFDQYLAGIGSLDDPDEQYNRVLHTIRDEYERHINMAIDSLSRGFVQCINSCDEKHDNYIEYICSHAHLSPCVPESKVVDEIKRGSSSYQQRDETNSLSEFEQSFRITSNVEHVSASARDIHSSEYGRICPYTTSESKRVGLNRALSVMCGVDNNGFVTMPVHPFSEGKCSSEIVYLSALDELSCVVAPSNVNLEEAWLSYSDDPTYTVANCRVGGELQAANLSSITHQELSEVQSIGPLISTVPSANRDSGKRLVMTVSAQRQAIPTWKRERPLVTTGVDAMCEIGYTSAGAFIIQQLESRGIIDAKLENDTRLYLGSVRDVGEKLEVTVLYTYGNKDYTATILLVGGRGTVNGTLKYTKLATPQHADSNGKYYLAEDVFTYQNDLDVQQYQFNKSGIQMGKLQYDSQKIAAHSVALGCNVKVLFKSLAGYSYEDSIIVNEDFLLRYGLAVIKTSTVSFTLPKGAKVCANQQNAAGAPQLDALGYPIRGFYIQTGQEILSIKTVTAEGIAKYSTRVLGVGESGFVLSYQEYQRNNATVVKIDLGDILPLGVGDKLEGLHGNKGVVGRIMPAHEMMFTEDGEVPDVIVNPLGVLARLNLGQVVESALGAVAEKTGKIQILEPFATDSVQDIVQNAEANGLVEKTIYDGRTGLPFPRKAMLGNMYMLRLMHTSTSKYNATNNCKENTSLRTLQPMRCAGGGQRMSELCTWCLVSYNAMETLNSLFTVQSDSYRDKDVFDTAISRGNNTDIAYNSNNIDMLRAHFFMLGVNIAIGDDGATMMEPATEQFMQYLADGHICRVNELRNNAATPRGILHDASVFPVHKNAADNRVQYGYLPFKCEMIMPLFLHSSSVAGLLSGIFTTEDTLDSVFTIQDVKKFSRVRIAEVIKGRLALVGWKTLNTSDAQIKTFMDEYDTELPATFTVPVFVKCENSNRQPYGKVGISPIVELFKTYDVIDSLCRPDILDEPEEINNILMFNQRYSLEDLVVRGMLVPPVGYRPVMAEDSKASNPIDAVLVQIVGRIKQLLVNNLSEEGRSALETSLYTCLEEHLVVNLDKDKDTPSVIRQLSDHKSGISVIRDTLLAKRLTYSGRSVISIGPELAPGECGIPVVMLATIFEEHITQIITSVNSNYILKHIGRLNSNHSRKFIHKAVRYLAAGNLAGFRTFCVSNIKISPAVFLAEISRECLNGEVVSSFYRLFDLCYSQLLDILQELLDTHPALLNREPSLHKFSIQGFRAKPIDSYAIQLHPASCHGFNADYDGDQMAVFMPMHPKGIQDVKDKMMSDKNLIDPKDGSCIVALNQDIILGLYYATIHKDNSTCFVADSIAKVYHLPKFQGFGEFGYKSAGVCEEVIADIRQGLVDIHDIILCFYDGKKYIGEAGRLVVNAILPGGIGFTGETMHAAAIQGKYAQMSGLSGLCVDTNTILTKKTIALVEGKIIDYFVGFNLKTDDVGDTLADALNRLMHFGFMFADFSGITLSLKDFAALPVKQMIETGKQEAEKAAEDADEWYRLGCCSDKQRDAVHISIWTDAVTNLKKQITAEFKQGETFDRMSNIFMIIDSGARGDVSQLLSMSGLIGIVTNSTGQGIPSPIKSAYIDGLSSSAFFQNAATARRQVVSAQLTTADSGTLTRSYIYLNEHQHIRLDDKRCDAKSLWIDIDYQVQIPSEYANAQLVTDLDELKKIDLQQFEDIMIFPGQEEEYIEAYYKNIQLLTEMCDSKYFTGDLLSALSKLHLAALFCRTDEGRYALVEPKYTMSDVSRSQLLYRVVDINAMDAVDRAVLSTKAMDFLGEAPELLGDDIVIGKETIEIIEQNRLPRIPIFTVLGCKSTNGICRCCFGLNYSTLAFPDFGEHIGYQAVQAIGNPITQIILDSHKMEYTGGESVASKLTRVLSSQFEEAPLPMDITELPFATRDVKVRLSTHAVESEDSRGVLHSSKESTVDLYDGTTCIQSVPYTDISEVQVVPGQIVPKGHLVVSDIRGQYAPWMSVVSFTEVQKYIWKMLCSCFTSEFVYARHFEIFARSISEFGVAKETCLDKGIVKGNTYLTTILDEKGIEYSPKSVGINSAMTCSNKVIAGIAQEHLVARLTNAIVACTVDNPDSNISKFTVGNLSTAEQAIRTTSIWSVSKMEYAPAADDLAATASEEGWEQPASVEEITTDEATVSAADLFGPGTTNVFG